MNTSETIGDIAAAIVHVQSRLEPATKDATNPHFRSRYATLNAVWDAVRPLLADAGLAVIQMPVSAAPGHVGLTTRLVHAESGEWIESEVTAPLAKQDAQGVGSAITYLRRYSLAASLGVVADEDDDANAASAPPTAAKAQAPAQPRNLADLAAKKPAPKPAPKAKAEYPEDEYQTYTLTKVYRDAKETTRADGTTRSFTKYSALTEDGLRLSTLKDDFGVMLKEGGTVSAVIDPEERYRAHEILAIREVIEADILDADWAAEG